MLRMQTRWHIATAAKPFVKTTLQFKPRPPKPVKTLVDTQNTQAASPQKVVGIASAVKPSTGDILYTNNAMHPAKKAIVSENTPAPQLFKAVPTKTFQPSPPNIVQKKPQETFVQRTRDKIKPNTNYSDSTRNQYASNSGSYDEQEAPKRKLYSDSRKAAGKGRDRLKQERSSDRKQLQKTEKPQKTKIKNIYLQEATTVANLGTLLGVTYDSLSRKMRKLGFEHFDSDYVLNSETASLVVVEYGFNPVEVQLDTTDLTESIETGLFQAPRPPVVTILGHVDHGKTTLLDALRKTSVVSGEAGGITQHIGAFSVLLQSGKRITFLDTPGHAAFSSMRERGAQSTDIVILVVAADDGVMPQTKEAIKHAINANVPIIVALNKCDKPDVDLEKTKVQLLEAGITIEEYGEALEEIILTIAELQEYSSDPSAVCEGVIIESNLTQKRGYVSTMLVKRGTVKRGTFLVAGTSWCKVRELTDENGNAVKKAGPSYPVEILGWKGLPAAGDICLQADSEVIAKKVVANRQRKKQMEDALLSIESLNQKRIQDKLSETPLVPKDAEIKPNVKVLHVIIKADVDGSLDAIKGVVASLPSDEVCVNIVLGAVGKVTQSDLELATATSALLFTFNASPDRSIVLYARQNDINISTHEIIYTFIDAIKEKMSDLLPPEIVIKVLGEAPVLQVYMINQKKKMEPIAGCKVALGKILKANTMRVMRDGIEVFRGKLKTLKHLKKDILEAAKGLECGIDIEYHDIKFGDVIQAISIIENRRNIK